MNEPIPFAMLPMSAWKLPNGLLRLLRLGSDKPVPSVAGCASGAALAGAAKLPGKLKPAVKPMLLKLLATNADSPQQSLRD